MWVTCVSLQAVFMQLNGLQNNLWFRTDNIRNVVLKTGYYLPLFITRKPIHFLFLLYDAYCECRVIFVILNISALETSKLVLKCYHGRDDRDGKEQLFRFGASFSFGILLIIVRLTFAFARLGQVNSLQQVRSRKTDILVPSHVPIAYAPVLAPGR